MIDYQLGSVDCYFTALQLQQADCSNTQRVTPLTELTLDKVNDQNVSTTTLFRFTLLDLVRPR